MSADIKLAGYHLNINHSNGNIKATFLIERKFNKDTLRATLVKQAEEKEVKEITDSEFGTKYIICA